MRCLQLLILVGIELFLSLGCQSDPYKVDISDKKSRVQFHQIDSIMFHSATTNDLKMREEIMQIDSEIGSYIFEYCYHIPLKPDSVFQNRIHNFYSDSYTQKIERDLQKKFSYGHRYQKEIADAFIRLSCFFPKGKMPSKVLYINSGFSSSVFCTEKSVSIGLERYLGPKNPCISELPSEQFYAWIKEGMQAKFMSRDVVIAWLMTHYIDESNDNFSSEMIRWGKILFITKACLPDEKIENILRYETKDFQWAMSSEYSFWRYLIDEALLFNTSEDPKQRLLKEGPYSMGLPQESPDRMGQFLGFRMVSQFADQNKISLEELVKTPYNKILQNYKPEKP